jgi:NitT/TauT family transport system substrate-binding protein
MEYHFCYGRLRRAAVWSFMLLALLLTACSQEASGPLRVASSPWPGYEPLYLARDVGYLPADKANIYELPSSDITLESFRNRSADIATLTLDETLDLLHAGVKLRVLVVMDSSNGADAVMVTPKIKKLSDLRGKRIAIENIPLGVYMLSRLLDAAKLSRDDVQVIITSESKHEEMYRQNKADAFITFEPFKTNLAALGAHDIFNSSNIPNEIFDLMVVHEDVYAQRRGEVCNVVRQWYRSLAYMNASPVEAAASISKRLGVKQQEFTAMLNGIKTPTLQENLQMLSGDQPSIMHAARKLSDVMVREGQLSNPVEIGLGLDPHLNTCVVQ